MSLMSLCVLWHEFYIFVFRICMGYVSSTVIPYVRVCNMTEIAFMYFGQIGLCPESSITIVISSVDMTKRRGPVIINSFVVYDLSPYVLIYIFACNYLNHWYCLLCLFINNMGNVGEHPFKFFSNRIFGVRPVRLYFLMFRE